MNLLLFENRIKMEQEKDYLTLWLDYVQTEKYYKHFYQRDCQQQFKIKRYKKILSPLLGLYRIKFFDYSVPTSIELYPNEHILIHFDTRFTNGAITCMIDTDDKKFAESIAGIAMNFYQICKSQYRFYIYDGNEFNDFHRLFDIIKKHRPIVRNFKLTETINKTFIENGLNNYEPNIAIIIADYAIQTFLF
jgi:hypothetical protein